MACDYGAWRRARAAARRLGTKIAICESNGLHRPPASVMEPDVAQRELLERLLAPPAEQPVADAPLLSAEQVLQLQAQTSLLKHFSGGGGALPHEHALMQRVRAPSCRAKSRCPFTHPLPPHRRFVALVSAQPRPPKRPASPVRASDPRGRLRVRPPLRRRPARVTSAPPHASSAQPLRCSSKSRTLASWPAAPPPGPSPRLRPGARREEPSPSPSLSRPPPSTPPLCARAESRS